MRFRLLSFAPLAVALSICPVLPAQRRSMSVPPPAAMDDDTSHRTRLYLKDGSFQVVLSYRVTKSLVIYRSAERAGQQEEIPIALVDLDRTRKWEQQKDPSVAGTPVLDPELAREELQRTQRVAEVAPNLHLPERESALALDIWRAQPQLVPLTQTDGDLNRQTAHNLLRQTINPFAHAHQLVQIKGSKAGAQMHVDTPEFYVRLDRDEDAGEALDTAFKVDTSGAGKGKGAVSSPKSTYVIVRCDVRQDVRVVSSFSTNLLGSGKREEDVVQTTQTMMPGGFWLKVVPKEPLLVGEYAMIEVLNNTEVNLSVWDFGVHPTAPANRDAIVPQERRRPSLETRSRP